MPDGMTLLQIDKKLLVGDTENNPQLFIVNADLTRDMINENTEAGIAIYTKDDGTHSISGEPLPDNETQITFTNEIKYSLIVKKTETGTAHTLGGAYFKLYNATVVDDVWEKGTEVVQNKNYISSSATGEFSLGMLSPGHYLLEEIKAPTGYVIMGSPIKVTVTADGVTYQQDGTVMSTNSTGISTSEEMIYTINVVNSAGAELPATGGAGTQIFYTIGTMMIFLASVIFLMKRSRFM